VTEWSVIWLGVIAVSVALIALVQIGLILVTLRLALQLSKTASELRQEVRPLMDKVNRIADDAARATALATVQVERVDQFLSTTAARVDDVAGIVRNAMGGPLRQGYAAAMALRAIIAAFRRSDSRERRTRDDEDALFVG
jgi:hypothetical protein